jgi:hypothetical protein
MSKLIAYLMTGRRLLEMTTLCCRDKIHVLVRKNFDRFSNYRENIIPFNNGNRLFEVVHGCILKHHVAPPSVVSVFKRIINNFYTTIQSSGRAAVFCVSGTKFEMEYL